MRSQDSALSSQRFRFSETILKAERARVKEAPGTFINNILQHRHPIFHANSLGSSCFRSNCCSLLLLQSRGSLSLVLRRRPSRLRFLVIPYGLLWSEVTSEKLLLVDSEGLKL